MSRSKNAKVKRLIRRHKRSKPATIMLTSLIDIFTVLVFFLIVNSQNQIKLPNSEAMRLPKSISDELPKETLAIQITQKDIYVQETKIASIDQVMASNSEVIQPLADELKYRATKVKAEVNAQGIAEREIYILGDKDVPYNLLRKVMVTCSLNDFSKISFAVERNKKGGKA